MIVRHDMRRFNQIDTTRIDHDEPRSLAQLPLHLRGKNRMRIGGIRADHHDDVGSFHGVEILGASRGPQCALQAVTGWGVAHARAGIDVIVAESGPHHFLDQVCFFVRASRGSNSPYRVSTILGLNTLKFASSVADCLIPAYWAPRVVDLGPYHGFQAAVPVGGVSPGEAAL